MARLKITQLCERCGKSFHPWPKRKEQVRRMYCSIQCRELPAEERLWSQVKKTEGCWEWTGGTDRDGYGRFFEMRRAHRFSWYLHNGPIPDGLHVLHTCDNPPCVRPDHLFLGTNTDNVADKIAKGRGQFGERHGMAIITESQVSEIRQRYAAGGISQTALGAEYGLSQTGISQIVMKKCWKHID